MKIHILELKAKYANAPNKLRDQNSLSTMLLAFIENIDQKNRIKPWQD
jgi:hypothetical protein